MARLTQLQFQVQHGTLTGQRVSDLIEAVGVGLLNLSPDSLEFYPTRMACSEFKALLRKVAGRKGPASLEAISRLTDRVAPPTFRSRTRCSFVENLKSAQFKQQVQGLAERHFPRRG